MIIPRRISREREHHTGGACAHDSGCGTQVRQFAPQLHALSCDMSFCSFQHTHQHTHAALDDGAPCAMTLIIIGVSSAAAYHSLARTRSISAMRVYVYLCVDIPRHTCCAVGPSPNSWPPRDECHHHRSADGEQVYTSNAGFVTLHITSRNQWPWKFHASGCRCAYCTQTQASDSASPQATQA